MKSISPTWRNISYIDDQYQLKDLNLSFTNMTVSGMSSGGTFSSNLMSMYHKYIAGLAIWSGETISVKNGSSNNFLKDKPVYIFHGIQDTIVPIHHAGENQ